ncbi:MAG: hypothetical protein AAGF20_02845 [Pseudomonadota bacterium]
MLAPPDPEAWSPKHDAMVKDYAEKLKAQIDDKGYYSKTLTVYAGRLADATGQPVDQMKATIPKSFEAQHGKDPYTYLNEIRVAQGKPTRIQDQRVTHDPQ